jgi:hypothetical protein
MAAIALAACSGSHGADGLPETAVVQPPAAGDLAGRVAAKGPRAKLELRLAIPRAKRHPHYISPSTMSISIAEGKTTIGKFATTPTTKGCLQQNGSTVCTYEMLAIPGAHQKFSIDTYDNNGNLLSDTAAVQTIAASKANTLSVTLNGVPSTLSLQLSDATPEQQTPATITLTVSALDADGNLIVGPGNYAHAIVLTDSDKSGATSLGTSEVVSPANNAVSIAYNGNPVTATFTASATGVTNATAELTSVKPHSSLIGGVWAALPNYGSIAYYNGTATPTSTLSSSALSLGTAKLVSVDDVGRTIGAYANGTIAIWPINATGNATPSQVIATGSGSGISAIAWDPIEGRVIFAPAGQSEFGVVPNGSSGSGITYYSASQDYPIAQTIAGIAIDQTNGDLYVANATPYGYDAANQNCDLLPNNDDCTSILVFTLQANGTYAYSHSLSLLYYCNSGTTLVDIGGIAFDSAQKVLWVSEADSGYPYVYGYNSSDTGCPSSNYSFQGDGADLVTPGSIAADGSGGIWVADQSTTWLQHWVNVYSSPTLPDANSYFLGPNNGNVSPTSIAVYSVLAPSQRHRRAKE